MYTAIRWAFVLVAAVFSSSVFGDYVANRIDYVDPSNGTVANFTQLWSINNRGNALGFGSFDSGVTGFSFVYDPATGNYLRLPQPPGFDGITSFAQAVGINDAGVMTGATFEPTGIRSFTLKDGVFTFFSIPGCRRRRLRDKREYEWVCLRPGYVSVRHAQYAFVVYHCTRSECSRPNRREHLLRRLHARLWPLGPHVHPDHRRGSNVGRNR